MNMSEPKSPRDRLALREMYNVLMSLSPQAVVKQRHLLAGLIEPDRGDLWFTVARLTLPILLLSPALMLHVVFGGPDGRWLALVCVAIIGLGAFLPVFRQSRQFVETARWWMVSREGFEKHRLVVCSTGQELNAVAGALSGARWPVWVYDESAETVFEDPNQKMVEELVSVFEVFRRQEATVVVLPVSVAGNPLMLTAVFETPCVHIMGPEDLVEGAVPISKDEAMDSQGKYLAAALGIETDG